MKKSLVILVLVLIAALLTGMALAESGLQSDPMSITPPAGSSFSLPDGYDPASEEDNGVYTGGTYNDYGRSVYAGATPIPLDPIDMPTPTPKPKLPDFSYGVVTADKIRLSFEAPAGWRIDTTADDAIVVQDPNTIDGYNATLTVRLYPVASNFGMSDLRTELKNMLKDLGQYNYSSWKTTAQANRTLLKKDGYYADYEGVYYDGTAIYGRVMMALLDNHQVLMVHLSCPDGYFNSSYKGVINHVRETLKQL